MKQLILILVCLAGASLHAQNAVTGGIIPGSNGGGGAPTGAAGGSLSGTYPNPGAAIKTTDTVGGVTLSTLSGVMKFVAGVPTVAGSSDITGLWSGTCNSTTFLAGNGVCGTVTFPQTVSVAGAASSPMLLFNGTWFTSGSATTNSPQVFEDGGSVHPTDFNTSGEGGFAVNTPAGYGGSVNTIWINGTKRAWVFVSGGSAYLVSDGWQEEQNRYFLGSSVGGLRVQSVGLFSWSSTSNYTGTADLGISRLAAGALGVGTGTGGTFSSTLQAGITATDPGCTTTSHIGKQWFDITTTTTVYKVCLNVAGTLTWVTK